MSYYDEILVLLMSAAGAKRRVNRLDRAGTGTVTDVTEKFSKTHLSVRQGAPQDTTSDIQLYDT